MVVGLRRLVAVVAPAAFALANPAGAQVAAASPKPMVITDLSLVSDYRYDGLSNSDRHGALQGSFYLWRPDKLFAGIFASTVDNGASAEIDVYGGRKFDVGKTQVQVQALAAFFTDQKFRAYIPTYNFVQATVGAERSVGPATLNASLAWTPAGSAGAGEAWRIAAGGALPVRRWLTLSGRVGHVDAERGQDRTFWDVGATVSRGPVSLDLRYVDSNLDNAHCFSTDWCAASVIAKLTWRLPPLTLR